MSDAVTSITMGNRPQGPTTIPPPRETHNTQLRRTGARPEPGAATPPTPPRFTPTFQKHRRPTTGHAHADALLDPHQTQHKNTQPGRTGTRPLPGAATPPTPIPTLIRGSKKPHPQAQSPDYSAPHLQAQDPQSRRKRDQPKPNTTPPASPRQERQATPYHKRQTKTDTQ